MELTLSQLESNYQPDQIVARDSKGAISAAGLLSRIKALAEQLIELKISILALHADNGIDWLVVDLSCQIASICLIPIPGFFSASQVEHVLKQAPVDACISDDPAVIEACLGNRSSRRVGIAACTLSLLLFQASTSAHSLPPDTGKVTFTSGSTGTPKGVCLSNFQLQQQARALAETVSLHSPRHLCLLPLSTLLENVAGIYAPLFCGGEVLLPGLAEIGFSGSSALDQQAFVQTISRYEPNSIILTPQLLVLLVTAARSGWQAPDSLRFVAVGGGKVPPALLAEVHQRGIPAFEGYGLSECASVVSLNTPDQNQTGTCGRPLAHVQLNIEDGEIVVKGNAMLGYLGEPGSWGLSAVQTGDLGYINDQGYVVINGRKKNLLISSFGRNINPEWVESELMSQPLLSECVVLGDARPYCVALLSPRLSETGDDLIQRHVDRVNLRLPDYARIKRWHRLSRPLASHQNLLTANGRPRRELIAAHFASLVDRLYPPSCQAESA